VDPKDMDICSECESISETKINLDIWCVSLDRQAARRKPAPTQDNTNAQK